MSAVEVRDRLGDRFRLLTGPELGPDRQATLRHAVAWSYDLLDDDERATLRAASVFAGGFDLPALCAVAEASDDVEVLRLLDSLVRKSLVIAHHGSARTRYSLFETIRAFADERLAETGERERGPRPARGVLRGRGGPAVGAAGTAPRGATQVDWVQTELANLRSAFRWSVDRGHVEIGDRRRRARRPDGVLGRAVRDHRVGRGRCSRRRTRADVRRLPRLYAAAGYACFVGRAAVATANAHRATELEAPTGLRVLRARLRDVHRGARTGLLRQPGPLRRADPRGRGAAGPGQAYGIAAYVDGLQSAGRVEEALELTEPAVAAARELGNPYWLAYTLWIVGLAYSKADPQRALRDLGRGRRLPRRARRPVLRGLPGPRRRPPAHLGRPAGDGADPLRHLDRGVPALRRRGPAGHHAGQPAGPVRAARPSRRRAHPARRDGPRAGQLPPRARRSPISASGSTRSSARRRRQRFAAAGARDGPPRRRGVRRSTRSTSPAGRSTAPASTAAGSPA